jgi:hypothetical protein
MTGDIEAMNEIIAGLDKDYNTEYVKGFFIMIHPTFDPSVFLEMVNKAPMGIPIIIGSDAHSERAAGFCGERLAILAIGARFFEQKMVATLEGTLANCPDAKFIQFELLHDEHSLAI